MTERRGDPGFSVAPRRLGDDSGPGGRGDRPRPRRVRQLGITIVVVAAAAVVTIAWLGPRLSGRPNFDLSFFATPTPGGTPSASATRSEEPTTGPLQATPLPEITRPEGGTAASGHVALGLDGMSVLDLASGSIRKALDTAFGRDAVVRASDGNGWICICLADDFLDAPVRTVRIARIDPIGRLVDQTDVLTVPVGLVGEFGQEDLQTDADIRVDGRRGLLAMSRRDEQGFRLTVAALDIEGRSAGPVVELGLAAAPPPPVPPSVPAEGPPSPSADIPTTASFDGPHVRIAPGGRVAFVYGIVQEVTLDSVTALRTEAWRVALAEDGSVGEVAAVDGFDGLPAYCGSVGFAAADRLAWVCPPFSIEATTGTLPGWQAGTVDLDGRSAGMTEVPLEDGYFSEPLFDRANGQIYAWNARELNLVRVDSHTLAQTSVTFDPSTTAGPGVAPYGEGDPPDWHDADSAVQMAAYSEIAAAPDGSRLYVLGFAEPKLTSDAQFQASLGIFVIDRSTLALVGRWAPAASYVALAVTPDGQVLAAAYPGFDADGRQVPWQASLTVHDPVDGRIVVRLGRVGPDSPPIIFDR